MALLPMYANERFPGDEEKRRTAPASTTKIAQASGFAARSGAAAPPILQRLARLADTGFLAAVSWARYRKPQHTYNAVGDVRMRPLSKMSQRNANVKDHETPRKIFGRLLAL